MRTLRDIFKTRTARQGRRSSGVKSESVFVAGLFALACVSSGCDRGTQAAAGEDCSRAGNCTDGHAGTTGTTPEPAVSRIAFVDLEDSCDCTRRRIDAAWGALQSALGAGAPVAVDRIHLDTQEALVAPYREQKPFQFVPAVYFMDADQNVIVMLQGELSRKQVEDVLKGSSR